MNTTAPPPRRTERFTAILDLLAGRGSVEVEELVAALAVSPATVRRDLDALAGQRLLTRTRGGATRSGVAYELPTKYGRDKYGPAKASIAQLAADLIAPGEVIGLCGGTTSTALASVLATREFIGAPGVPGLTVVTNAINIAAQLAVRPHLKVMVTGGVLNPRSYELAGPFAEHALANITIDKAFVGVNGIDPEFGPTIDDENEAAVNTMFARRARETYLIADSSKIGLRAFATMEGFDFTRLITDDGVTPAQVKALEDAGVTVLVGHAGRASDHV